ncbi:MAG: DUF3667 domain-containing protein [Saprospiraceae bacterium]|nr:DUF3667 domain-containing protein [Saprospiraceae bacterium]
MARIRVKQIFCSNCQYLFDQGENFCPNCGQENHHPNQPIRHYIAELIETLLHLDSKFFLTLKALLTKPGLATKEYNQNKRARFMPPIRLYVFISFIFFLLIQIDTSNNKTFVEAEVMESEEPGLTTTDSFGNQYLPSNIPSDTQNFSMNVGLLKLNLDKNDLSKLVNASPEEIDSLILVNKQEPNYLTRTATRQMIKAFNADPDFKKNLKSNIIKNTSIAMFFLMPLFGFILYLLHIRQKKNYYEFLIFSIHYHIVAFFAFSILFLFEKIWTVTEGLYFLTILGLYAYLWIALKITIINPGKNHI